MEVTGPEPHMQVPPDVTPALISATTPVDWPQQVSLLIKSSGTVPRAEMSAVRDQGF